MSRSAPVPARGVRQKMDEKVILKESEVADLLQMYPMLPKAYLAYLLSNGAGEAPSGRIIYSQPIHPNCVYPSRAFDKQLILLGDDMMGYCLALDTLTGELGELSPRGEWQIFPSSEGFESYVAAAEEGCS